MRYGQFSLDKSLASRRERLVKRAEKQGYDVLVEHIAYTWFNRFCAIRYMELHGYLDHGFRMLSHPTPKGVLRFWIMCRKWLMHLGWTNHAWWR